MAGKVQRTETTSQLPQSFTSICLSLMSQAPCCHTTQKSGWIQTQYYLKLFELRVSRKATPSKFSTIRYMHAVIALSIVSLIHLSHLTSSSDCRDHRLAGRWGNNERRLTPKVYVYGEQFYNGKRIFVVPVANISAVVSSVRATVDDTWNVLSAQDMQKHRHVYSHWASCTYPSCGAQPSEYGFDGSSILMKISPPAQELLRGAEPTATA